MSEKREKPNLFKFATSELSQDAVLAYMLAWADTDHKETTKLHKLGQDLLSALLSESEKALDRIGPESEETPKDEVVRIKDAIRQIRVDGIKTVAVKRQDNNIDVSVDINKSLFVIVEDKTETIRHGDQIRRYKEAAKERFESDGKNREVVAVYFKTGNESASYNPAPERAACFFRADVLEVLGKHQNTGSDIIEEFRIHLQRLQDDTNSFKKSKLVALDDHGNSEDGWSWHAHQGYFMHLERKLNWGEKGWGYTPNPAGGHLEFYSGSQCCKHMGDPQPVLALQVIYNKGLFIRIVKLGDYEKVYAHFLYPMFEKIAECAKAERFDGLHVRKPSRFGTGASANVAQICFEDEVDDYRATNREGKIDLNATVNRLDQAMEFLRYICENITSD